MLSLSVCPKVITLSGFHCYYRSGLSLSQSDYIKRGFQYTSYSISFCLSFYLSVFLSVLLSVCLSVCLYVFVSFCLSVFLSFCLFVFLFLCLLVFLSFCLSVFLSFCLSIFLSYRLSVSLSFCLTVFLSLLWVIYRNQFVSVPKWSHQAASKLLNVPLVSLVFQTLIPASVSLYCVFHFWFLTHNNKTG